MKIALIAHDYNVPVDRSPPPEKGKPRTMSAVWDKTKLRVRYMISDGHKQGVHFLITYRSEKEKDVWE